MEQILAAWDAFARTLEPAASNMSGLALRDHAKGLLLAIAEDIDTHQSAQQQIAKSQGHAPGESNGSSAAAAHGTQRRMSGFSLVQLAAEFRALRATVIRLWMEQPTRSGDNFNSDIVRFNETIDQALAESIITYTGHADRTRDTFLAILGHDLRSPLATVSLAGELLVHRGTSIDQMFDLGRRVKRAAASMNIMVGDLLEFARTQLGGDIPIVLAMANLRDVCQWSIDDAYAVHPDCTFALTVSGELDFPFDAARLQQVFSNLLNNAAQFNERGRTVTIDARDEGAQVVVEVRNVGAVIPPGALRTIFEPMVQLKVQEDVNGSPSTSLGLGLFIAREIVTAHGGSIAASSDIDGTLFAVRIPRAAPAPASPRP